MRRLIIIAVLGVATLAHLPAQSVLASTSWTAAFALAAGAQEVEVLAPYTYAHPPEYELRPSDISRVNRADLIIYAGYETMASRLVDAAGVDSESLLRINTIHSWPVIVESVGSIAQELNTVAQAEINLAEIRSFLDQWKDQLAADYPNGLPGVVHFHQQGLAREIGIDVIGVYGPGPLQARQIKDLTDLGPVVIIDNGHNPIGSPLQESSTASLVTWYNFPNDQASATILDVLKGNRSALSEVGGVD